MIISLVESDAPKVTGEWLAQFLARPPMPIIRFFDEPRVEGKAITFRVRNGLPLPLLYGVYISTNGDYAEKADHIGPFGVDTWKVTFDTAPSTFEIKVGLVPFELQTDMRRSS